MSVEIERKFLVVGDDWLRQVSRRHRIRQGYLSGESGFSIRVREIDGASATLTVKSARAGIRRLEFEYQIPLTDAAQLLAMCQGPLIEKVRHIVAWHGRSWEVDVFEGENGGLVVAEIELESEHATADLPPWAGSEITGDSRYYNSSLARRPYCSWGAGASHEHTGSDDENGHLLS